MKAVFFDAGGTLVHLDYGRVAAVVRDVTGTEPAVEGFVAAEYQARDAVEAAMAQGLTPTDRSRWVLYFRALLGGVGVGDADFVRIQPAIIAEHQQNHLWSALAPGTGDALAALQRAGYLVACISNADGTVDRLLEAAGLLRHLAFVIDSGVVGIEKPDPRIFVMALERAGVRAEDSLYVGDLFPVDVVGARSAGLEPVLLDPLGRYVERGVRTTPDVPTLARELVSAREAA